MHQHFGTASLWTQDRHQQLKLNIDFLHVHILLDVFFFQAIMLILCNTHFMVFQEVYFGVIFRKCSFFSFYAMKFFIVDICGYTVL